MADRARMSEVLAAQVHTLKAIGFDGLKLIEGKPIVRGYLGVSIQNLRDRPGMARQFGLTGDDGVLVGAVLEGGPADKAGVERGDIVLEYDGHRVATNTDLSQRVAATKPGKTVPLTIWRDGKEKTIRVTVEPQPEGFSTRPGFARPRAKPKPQGKASADEFGFTVETLTPELAKKHYAEHVQKEWYPRVEAFITASPLVAAILEGPEAIRVVREMVGATSGLAAAPGTIRGDYGSSQQMNLVHASDGPESAAREIGIFFRPEEIHAYEPTIAPWLCTEGEC